MLDAFVLPAGMPHSDVKATIKSLEKLPFNVNIIQVGHLEDVISHSKTSPYYGFFWDVESFDKGLEQGIRLFLRVDKFDVLVLYKKNSRTGFAEFRPRIFREHIRLNPRNMLPIVGIGLNTEDVLNGWILEHGFEGIHGIPSERLYEMVKGGHSLSNTS